MNLIKPIVGRPPWVPTVDAEPLVSYDHDEEGDQADDLSHWLRPPVGVFRSGGTLYLFRLRPRSDAEGRERRATVWFITPITRIVSARLGFTWAHERDDFAELVQSIRRTRRGTTVFAVDDMIVDWEHDIDWSAGIKSYPIIGRRDRTEGEPT